MSFLSALLAQTTQPAPQPPAWMTFMPFVVIFVLIYFMMIRPQRRERDRQQKLLSSIKKNDRVMTIGGLFGVVANVQGDEVTLKVDESTNTKLTFSRTAIKTIFSADQPPGGSAGA